jgi:hypothetical protein
VTHLEKILRLAAEEEHAHDFLMSDCPWYAQVHHGKNADPASCRRAHGRLTVSLTPHTAEASTVDKPTVPPGGPGLFHHKGLHLPPYIQHLWFHLVKEYGKKKAYGVAVGVVKKWAAGTNPGGRHPTRTHPDVRAAAQKNVAEWEKDRTMGGKKNG